MARFVTANMLEAASWENFKTFMKDSAPLPLQHRVTIAFSTRDPSPATSPLHAIRTPVHSSSSILGDPAVGAAVMGKNGKERGATGVSACAGVVPDALLCV